MTNDITSYLPERPTWRESEIVLWGIARNLIGPTGEATMRGQLKKTREEVTELEDAIDLQERATGLEDSNPNRPLAFVSAKDMARDAIGDVYVTLVMHAQMWNLSMEECIEQAWSQIKDRKGRMVGGVFVKEA